MTTQQVMENIICCTEKMASSPSGGWNNIRTVQCAHQGPIYSAKPNYMK